ncbi:hypothetical protein [Mycolicibacterium elephantis]
MTDNWGNFESPEEKASREKEERSGGAFSNKEDTRREIEREIERRSRSDRDDES